MTVSHYTTPCAHCRNGRGCARCGGTGKRHWSLGAEQDHDPCEWAMSRCEKPPVVLVRYQTDQKVRLCAHHHALSRTLARKLGGGVPGVMWPLNAAWKDAG